jgi:translocation and assembly module TamB
MRKRYIAAIAFAAALGLVIAAAAGAISWLFYTEAGLAWIVARASGYGGEGLTIDGVAGTLAGGARVGTLRYAGKDMEVRVRDAGLSVSPSSVLTLTPRIVGLHAAEVAVTTKPGKPRDKPPDTLALPANFVVRNAKLDRLTVDTGSGPVEITGAQLDYSGGKSTHAIENLALTVLGMSVKLEGRIAATAPFALDAKFKAVRPDEPGATVDGSAGGNLSEITLAAEGRTGEARVTASAIVRQYEPLPIAALHLDATRLDLNAFVATLPKTRIEARVALERSRDGMRGPVALTNALPGPYDTDRLPLASLRANVQTDFKRATFTALEADLGTGGRISGSGDLKANAAEAALTTKNLNLAGVYSTLRATQLRGSVKLTLEDARQSVTADLAQDDIALRATAHRTGEKIDIPQFEARARGGAASGRAQLSTAKPRPFSADVTFSRFDPAAWGAFPSGSINGRLTAKGTIAGPSADLAFSIRDSRWLNAPFAAKGVASVTPDRVQNADVDVTLGRNRVSAKGALGAPRDTLALQFDAPQLALVTPALNGALRGRAEVSGRPREPRIRFDVTGSALAYGTVGRIDSLGGKGVVDLQPTGRSDAVLSARGISSHDVKLDSATLQIEGTRAAHTASAQARGERVDLQARVRGAWNPANGWSGTVQEVANRGEAPIELAAPVAVTIGPKAVRAEPFTVRAIGGELVVSELAYNNGRLATAGRFSDFPVKPVLALAGRPSEAAGTLRLTGQWAVRNTPQLTGTISINRQSGDVTLGPQSPVKIGLQTLALDATFAERGIDFRANVRSALATANAQGTIRPVGGRYTGASPFDFSAQADIAQLAAFAAFIDTPLIVRGEAHARLQGRGTLADPRITGPVTADGLAIALPAEGIDLAGGTLRATLMANQIKVESFSIRGGEGTLTASGTLARGAYDRASVDWQANRFRLLSRPDRRLVVSGQGNAGLESGKLSFVGKATANEGLFDIGETTLPRIGNDVVVVGRPAPVKKPDAQASLKGVSVNLTIDLGNQVEVRGQGLQVWLSGDLHVYTDRQGQIVGKGTVNARNGTFVAYGQRLEIERGVFYFNGPVSNPSLDVVAMRKRQAVEAGVAVSGPLKNPLVRIVSNPQVPEGEALSWLLLGRAPDRANAGQLAALPLATSALLGKATGSISKRLHVDELGLRGSGGAVGEQFVTVGKRISDRVYVYFEQGLRNTATLLRLELTITQRIVARVEAGTASSLGVFYRYKWD